MSLLGTPKAPNGRERFIEALMERGGITRQDAVLVYDRYKKLSVIRSDSLGQVRPIHGGFLDRAVIRRALREA